MTNFLPDIIIFVLLLISAGHGFVRGFIEDLLQILTWTIAFFTAKYFAVYMIPWLTTVIIFENFSSLVAYLSIFVSSIFILGLVTTPVRNILTRSTGLLNKIIGMFYGFLRGFFFLILIALGALFVAKSPGTESLIASSYIYSFSEEIAYIAFDYFGRPSIWNILPSFLR